MAYGIWRGCWRLDYLGMLRAPLLSLENKQLIGLQEWRNALRSAIHPGIFATVYYIANLISEVFQLSPATRADLLVAAPKTLQGILAALGDHYTWRLAQRIYGHESQQAWAALALTILSSWQWFCSTRTLSNCLETTLTIAALYNWPWQWSLIDRENAKCDSEGLRVREDGGEEAVDETTRLRRSLLLAALATILRPTNLLIWMTLAAMTCLKMSRRGWLTKLRWSEQRMMIQFTYPSFLRATPREGTKLVIESVLCGSAVLLLSVLIDRFYYQYWTFPPLKFIYFNVVQSLSVFYGRNDWHYYLSQGFPLLLTTALPFALVGIYQALCSPNASKSPLANTVLSQLATIICCVPSVLSLISHKEVRFIYPLLPILHILAAAPLTHFFAPSLISPLRSRLTPPQALFRRLILALLILLNATISLYTSTIHQRGVIDVLTYLRHQHETYYQESPPNANLTAAFLMPCHSTPWRSHLIHPSISAWALTCEPPVHLSPEAKKTYLDEADIFYANPMSWIKQNMSRQPPQRGRGLSHGYSHHHYPSALDSHSPQDRGNTFRRREWPDYLVFFSKAEETLAVALRGSGYVECWRGFNSQWHDDWRRQGDVVVWCLFPERKQGKVEARARARERERERESASESERDGKTGIVC